MGGEIASADHSLRCPCHDAGCRDHFVKVLLTGWDYASACGPTGTHRQSCLIVVRFVRVHCS